MTASAFAASRKKLFAYSKKLAFDHESTSRNLLEFRILIISNYCLSVNFQYNPTNGDLI